MRIAVVSSSLGPESKGLHLARLAAEHLRAQGHAVDFIDLRDVPLPLCGSDGSFEHPAVADLTARLKRADGILLASPVYNYDVNAAAKNLVELTGAAWEDKVVGFLLSAGGHPSYMSVLGFANSLMLDFRCIILPRFVYALSKEHFSGSRVSDAGIQRRVEELTRQLVRVAGALRAA
jgi:NAD(P)H-dependent FMN reductase